MFYPFIIKINKAFTLFSFVDIRNDATDDDDKDSGL
jgi:hypothetical protein